MSGPGAWYWQGAVFAANMNTKEMRARYPERSGEGSRDDSYRGYSIDTAHFDNDIYEGIQVESRCFVSLFE